MIRQSRITAPVVILRNERKRVTKNLDFPDSEKDPNGKKIPDFSLTPGRTLLFRPHAEILRRGLALTASPLLRMTF